MANSLTGLSIAGATAGVALVGYLGAWWPVTGTEWLGVFIGQCAIYGVVFTQAGSPISDIESAAVVQSD